MAFRPPKQLPKFSDLENTLAQTRKTIEPSLYKTIQQLIKRMIQSQDVITERITTVADSVTPVTPTGSDHYDAPLTDGDNDETDLIFAAGECIIVQVPNP